MLVCDSVGDNAKYKAVGNQICFFLEGKHTGMTHRSEFSASAQLCLHLSTQSVQCLHTCSVLASSDWGSYGLKRLTRHF